MFGFLLGAAVGAAGYWAWQSFGKDLFGSGGDQGADTYSTYSSGSSTYDSGNASGSFGSSTGDTSSGAGSTAGGSAAPTGSTSPPMGTGTSESSAP